MDILNDILATVRAESHHPPCVLSTGFCTKHSTKARSIGYEEEKSPTLRAGVVPSTIALENHPADSRVKFSEDGKVQTLTSRCGTGGGNVPLFIKISKTVAYGICSKHSNAMTSDNPKSGFYEAETSRTIDTSNQYPCKNQGGMVVLEGNGSRPSHNGDGYSESDTMYTLNTVETHSIAYSTSKDSFHTIANKNVTGTLVASDYKDSPTVSEEPLYIVRRLTPQECALLQGMPVWWCSNLALSEPAKEDLDFWKNVFEMHRKATAPDKKPKSDKQILKWLKNPYSDSASYKMWGNGIAMPCAWFVLSGIAHFAD